MTLYLMEITEDPGPEYARFATRRMLWRELGAMTSFDDLTHVEIQEAQLFMALENQHPHRFRKTE